MEEFVWLFTVVDGDFTLRQVFGCQWPAPPCLQGLRDKNQQSPSGTRDKSRALIQIAVSLCGEPVVRTR